MVTRQPKLESLQSLAAEVLLLPCDGTEREGVEKKLATLYSDWDEICTQVCLRGREERLGVRVRKGRRKGGRKGRRKGGRKGRRREEERREGGKKDGGKRERREELGGGRAKGGKK